MPAATPRELGYRMPAEWEPHEATWLAWPHNPDDWPGKFPSIPWLYAEIVRLIAARERVHLIVEDGKMERRVAGMVAITNWRFNAWAKYDDWRLDDQLPGRAAELLGCSQWQPSLMLPDGTTRRIVLEGGSIDVNGAGLMLTTEECLLSEVQQRNPGLSREQLEQAFSDYLGVDQVLWLGRGIAGDDTHGHIDDIARFAGADTIIAAVERDTSDPNHAPLAENLERIKTARTPTGKQFTVVELPMPRPVVFRRQRVPASYANFYLANGLVLVPTFHDPNDRIALNLLAEVFPDREVIGIHSVDLIWGLGALHCMTQQQPAGSSAS